MLMDHVTAMQAGLERRVTNKCVPPIALEMGNVIYKQSSVFVTIPILVSGCKFSRFYKHDAEVFSDAPIRDFADYLIIRYFNSNIGRYR